MNPGYGKQKGGQFERDICRKLSLWISHDKNPNLLWRSAMSGGRATLQKRAGQANAEQSGDISAVGEEGHNLIRRFYIECKFYSDLSISNFMLGRPSKLNTFWQTALEEATDLHKVPLLIAKQNRYPELIITTQKFFTEVLFQKALSHTSIFGGPNYNLHGPIVVLLFDALLDCCQLNNLSLKVNGEVKLTKSGQEVKIVSSSDE